jgi:hypothetical protein
LAGSFGVFFTGKLQAYLYDLQGLRQQVIDLQSVEPQTRVDLHREIKPGQQTGRVSIHLIDDQGVDRGSLGEVVVPSATP